MSTQIYLYSGLKIVFVTHCKTSNPDQGTEGGNILTNTSYRCHSGNLKTATPDRDTEGGTFMTNTAYSSHCGELKHFHHW